MGWPIYYKLKLNTDKSKLMVLFMPEIQNEIIVVPVIIVSFFCFVFLS